MSVARVRELVEAWRAGALRPDEERELQALLLDGGVLEAAERGAVPDAKELDEEAKRAVPAFVNEGGDKEWYWRGGFLTGYRAGVARKGRR